MMVAWLVLYACCGRPAMAQDDLTPAVPLDSLKGKPGGHHASLAERSPLSADLKAVAKRLGMALPPTTPATPPRPSGGEAGGNRTSHGAMSPPLSLHASPKSPAAPPKPPPLADLTDYDLAKESFYVYVPAAPSDDGTYGVMVGQCFKAYDAPPKAWPAILDAHHLIWIGAKDAGDDKTPCHRVGLLLDAAHNAAKVWPVDPDRVYLSMNAFVGPTAATAMDYPDVFDGQVQSIAVPWYAKIKTSGKTPLTYNTDDFPPPTGKYLSLARSHSRFFLAPRVESAADMQWDAVVRKGYKAANYKYVKAEPVPAEKMAEYWDLGADWFDHGVTFLDAPLAELKAKPHRNPMPKLPEGSPGAP